MTVGKKTGTFEVAYPDSLVGTDSHTTMVNGLAVLGWGVGGIEAEACMLGQPLSMLLPEVVGFKLKGQLKEGVTATDLVLTVTQMLRKQGVVGKFVEFFGPGLDYLSVADKATIGNMAPEYGATCGFFPVDAETIDYLKTSGRKPARVALVEAYAKAQGLFRTAQVGRSGVHRNADARSRRRRAVDGRPEASRRPRRAAGRRRPASPPRWPANTRRPTTSRSAITVEGREFRSRPWRRRDRRDHLLHQHLQPERADRRRPAGAQRRRQGPEGQAVGEDLARAGQRRWSRNISPIPACRRISTRSASTWSASAAPPASAIPVRCRRRFRSRSTTTASSPPPCCRATATSKAASRPDVQANYLASPPLVVAYALAGTVTKDLAIEPIGTGKDGKPVYPEGHLADHEGDQRLHEEVRHRDDLQEALRRRVQGRHQLAQDQDGRRARPIAGT